MHSHNNPAQALVFTKLPSALTKFQQKPADTEPAVTANRKEGLGRKGLCGIKSPEGKNSSYFLIETGRSG
jgi:hypothetical protein